MSRINQGTEGRRALVIGAGIVGTCSALYHQRQGFLVTMIDRQGFLNTALSLCLSQFPSRQLNLFGLNLL